MLQFGGSVGQSSEWSFKFVSLACELFPREACKFSDSRTLAISAHFFPSLDCCMAVMNSKFLSVQRLHGFRQVVTAVMNSKCLGNALVHCEGLITITRKDPSTVPTASASAPAGPAVEKGDKGYELGPAGPVAVQGGDKDHDLLQSKCLRNALVHDGLMTSTATNDSAPPPTSALAPAGPAAMEGGGKDDDTLPLDFWENDDLAVAASCVHLP